MRVRGLARSGWVGIAIAFAGCGTLGSATSSVSSTASQGASSISDIKSTRDTVKGMKDDAQSAADSAKEAMGKGGGAASSTGSAAAPGAAGPSCAGDPDCDGRRPQAKEIAANEPITDEVDPGKGDKSDWKVLQLGGRPGYLTVQLHWDEPSAELLLEVFDEMGANIAAAPKGLPQPARKLLVEIPEPGRYYLRVSSARGASVYTVLAKWAGPGAPRERPSIARPAPAPAAAAPSGGAKPASAAPVAAAADDPSHPRARILQSYRDDDGQIVLYLDKGSDANVKPGMSGTILEGDTASPLAGGSFRVTSVVGPSKSVAKSAVGKVGKNVHCVINLVE